MSSHLTSFGSNRTLHWGYMQACTHRITPRRSLGACDRSTDEPEWHALVSEADEKYEGPAEKWLYPKICIDAGFSIDYSNCALEWIPTRNRQ